MPLPAEYAKVIFDIQLDSYLASNVLWYQLNNPGIISNDEVNELEAAAQDLFTDPLVSCLSNQVVLRDIFAIERNATDTYTSAGELLSISGELAGTPLPNQDAVVFNKHLPALNGRLSRGHMYLSGVPEDHVTTNIIDGVLGPLLAVVAAAIFTELVTTGNVFTPAVVHLADGTFRTLTGCTVTPMIKSQRRRRPRS